jgi:hypothetical protein
VEDIDMAVPLSPDEVQLKRRAIFKHQSQKDLPLFPGVPSSHLCAREPSPCLSHIILCSLPAANARIIADPCIISSAVSAHQRFKCYKQHLTVRPVQTLHPLCFSTLFMLGTLCCFSTGAPTGQQPLACLQEYPRSGFLLLFPAFCFQSRVW